MLTRVVSVRGLPTDRAGVTRSFGFSQFCSILDVWLMQLADLTGEVTEVTCAPSRVGAQR